MFTDNDLRDPAPPTPGAPERAKVAVRAKQIKRNRRLTAAGGALGLVAVASLGAVALSGGGSSGPGTSRVEVAGAAVERETTVPTTVAPAPTTVAPAPATTPAPEVTTDNQTTAQETPAVEQTPAPAPVTTYTVSGVVPGYPTDATNVTGSVRLMGDGGTFTAPLDGDGSFSISGVPAGTYDASYSWQSNDGAMQVGHTTVTVNGDGSVSF